MIYVTKPFLPPLDEYIQYLQQIWASNQLTNNGPLVRELEDKLKEFLGAKHLFFVSNGTIALQIAIKTLGLKGEIITTPFSYVATTSSIVWEGCKPVFVDIDPHTLCLDSSNIEASITGRTIAILPTHVYGNPCDVEHIQTIADQYGLKVIYDAAHAFGVRYKGLHLVNYGDITTLSFHATKLFHTVEGGAIITNDDDVAHRVSYMRNFGHKGQEEFWGLGINGKNSEFHAAMGLCILSNVEEVIARRKNACLLYDEYLRHSKLEKPARLDGATYNYGYYPVLFSSEKLLLEVKDALNQNQIFPRRYFYPSINQLNYLNNQPMPLSEDIASRILCLPLYDSIEPEVVEQISTIITYFD